jgi:hypothetical protein
VEGLSITATQWRFGFAQLLVKPSDIAGQAYRNGKLSHPKLLIRLAKQAKITVELVDQVVKEQTPVSDMVVIEGLESFQQVGAGVEKPLVRLI